MFPIIMKNICSFTFLCLAFTFIPISTSLNLQYDSIFNFGDSLSDTGNALISDPKVFSNIGEFPYGETFFHKATGRCSDGRLIIDFIAEAARLPYLPPYLGLNNGLMNFKQGVNFAVAGATALGAKFFYDQNISLSTNDSLSIQLSWFKKFKYSFCTSKQECDDYFKKSLFLVGEFGVNDYNFQLTSGLTIQQVQATVPLLIEAITKAITVLIEDGAVELVVPGNLPLGCDAYYLTLFKSHNKTDYNPRNGCLKKYNALFKYHNNQLKKALQILRQKYPHTRIIYADYYGAAMRIYNSPQHVKFGEKHNACCGSGGEYNFNLSTPCGVNGTRVCNNPSSYANWDGIHLTEAAYKYIATGLINGPFTTPPLSASLASNSTIYITHHII